MACTVTRIEAELLVVTGTDVITGVTTGVTTGVVTVGATVPLPVTVTVKAGAQPPEVPQAVMIAEPAVSPVSVSVLPVMPVCTTAPLELLETK